MKKEIRKKVYLRYAGRCAYCGEDISYEEMQVDHKVPKALGGKDDIKNYMPSCRMCNYHKMDFSVEAFRSEIKKKINRVKNSNIRLLEKYGLVEFYDFDVVFYFEKGEKNV